MLHGRRLLPAGVWALFAISACSLKLRPERPLVDGGAAAEKGGVGAACTADASWAGIKLDARIDQVLIKSMTDLGFVRKVKVSLAPGTPSDTLPPVPVGEYVRGATAAPAMTEIKVPSTLDANVVKYLEKEPARLIFTATGALPPDPFTADVEACVFVQSRAAF